LKFGLKTVYNHSHKGVTWGVTPLQDINETHHESKENESTLSKTTHTQWETFQMAQKSAQRSTLKLYTCTVRIASSPTNEPIKAIILTNELGSEP
jgi:hypothetical protein